MPGIDQLNAAALEIPCVAGRQHGAQRPHNAGDHQVGVAARSPLRTTPCGDLGMRISSSFAVRQHMIRKARSKIRSSPASKAPLRCPWGKDMCAEQQLSAPNGRHEQFVRRVRRQPRNDARIRIRPEQLRDDIGIEHDHVPYSPYSGPLKSGDSRMETRGGSSSSTPPSGSTCARISATNAAPAAAGFTL